MTASKLLSRKLGLAGVAIYLVAQTDGLTQPICVTVIACAYVAAQAIVDRSTT